MVPKRHVRLFKSGGNEPAQPLSLLAVLATLDPLDEEFPAIAELPDDPVEL